jgi:hypothetical protein
MRRGQIGMFWFLLCCFAAPCVRTQTYPPIDPTRRTFDVPEVDKANVLLIIQSRQRQPLYKLQCHSRGYSGDPDFDYSGDFECRLTSVGQNDKYSTLLTEDAKQSRDWESRGRFFASELRGPCAEIPEFGATRDFRLRGMDIVLQITQPEFTADKLVSLKLTVTVLADEAARRSIAAIVPLPKTRVPAECKLQEHFVDFATLSDRR